MTKKKKIYTITSDMMEDNTYLVVVDMSYKKVLKKTLKGKYLDFDDENSIDIKVKEEIDASDFGIGYVDCEKALIIGAYGWIEEGECSKCKEYVGMDKDNVKDGKLVCNDCLFDMVNDDENKD